MEELETQKDGLDPFELEVERLGLKQPFEAPYWQSRAFQLCASHHVHRNKRTILSIDKGLGKTGTILSTFEPMANAWDQSHTSKWTGIILTTKRGMTAYTRDIKKFPEAEGKVVLIHTTDKGARRNLWRKHGGRYFVCTYAGFLSDLGYRATKGGTSEVIVPNWVRDSQEDMLACDEFHRVFRNHTSLTFKVLRDHTKQLEFFVPLSGSAVSDGPEDLWPALHLCDPKFWSSYWKYVYTWCEITEGQFGRQVKGPKLDPNKMGGVDIARVERWRAAIKPYCYHVTAEMVQHEVPPINNYPLDVIMEPWQKRLHDDLASKLYTEIKHDGGDSEFVFAQNSLQKTHLLRTALICPKAIDPSLGVGAGIEAVADDVEESGIIPYAVFTPFRAPIPHLEEYLRARGHRVWVLWGGITLEEQEERLSKWRKGLNDGSGRPVCILSTVKYGESWEIPEASNGYFLGAEWDPEDNDQARKRLRRLISKRPVNIQWVRHLDSYETEFLQYLMDKTGQKRSMFRGWKFGRGGILVPA